MPCPEQLDARIAYLRSLGIDEEKLNNVVRVRAGADWTRTLRPSR